MLRFLPTLLLAAAGSTSLGAVLVQQEKPVHETQGMPDAQANRVLSTWLLAYDKASIELARFAEQRAQDPRVKQLAQKIATENQDFAQKLQPYAVEVATNRPGGEQQPGAKPVEAGAGRTPGEMGFDHMALVDELAKECLRTARSELEKKQGAEFDMAFVQMAYGNHLGAQDMLAVFERHATAKFKGTLTEGKTMVDRRLQEVRQLAQQMEQKK